jgi:hypothetical protein
MNTNITLTHYEESMVQRCEGVLDLWYSRARHLISFSVDEQELLTDRCAGITCSGLRK